MKAARIVGPAEEAARNLLVGGIRSLQLGKAVVCDVLRERGHKAHLVNNWSGLGDLELIDGGRGASGPRPTGYAFTRSTK
jgi:hypothetical protein